MGGVPRAAIVPEQSRGCQDVLALLASQLPSEADDWAGEASPLLYIKENDMPATRMSRRLVFHCSEHHRVFLGAWRPIGEVTTHGLRLQETACDECERIARDVLTHAYPPYTQAVDW